MSTRAVTTSQRELGEAIMRRIIATGTLSLTTAARFGGGASDATDAALLRDGDDRPFIPGASLAGALRGYLRRRTIDAADAPAGQRDRDARALAALFGGGEDPPSPGRPNPETSGNRRTGEDFLSMLAVDDAFVLGDAAGDVATALRDRVRIDPTRRTADDQGKFDYEVLEPGASFAVRLELALREAHRELHDDLRRLFNALLDALTAEEIRLGAHTRRGMGRVSVERWSVLELDLSRPSDVVRWLRGDEPDEDCPQRCGAAGMWDAMATLPPEGVFAISAELELAGPLLLRSTDAPRLGDPGSPPVPDGALLHLPDVVQLTSGGRAVIPGTSLAGVLRHRALRICRALGMGDEQAAGLVAAVWGPLLHRAREEGPERDTGTDRLARASRLLVDDAFVDGGALQRQTRIAVDRFTGGARGTALLEEAPLWPGRDQPATLRIGLRLLPKRGSAELSEAECGLLLLLLKDLCTGDLPVGGGAAVGRGILRGRRGTIELRTAERRRWRWRAAADGALTFDEGDPNELEAFVEAFASDAKGEADA